MSVKNKYPYLEFNTLPKLPIPELKDTMEKYLLSVQPIISAEDFEKEKEIVKDFLENEGPRLHEEVKKLSDESPTSFLEGFWDNAYQSMRGPLCININPTFQMGDDPKKRNMVQRAASICVGALKFNENIAKNQLKQDMERTTPLCMFQYGKLFGSTRIPQLKRDRYAEFTDCKYIVVMSKNQFFKMPIYNEKGEMHEEGHFASMIEKIHECAKAGKDVIPIGIATSENRDTWAKLRTQLLLNPKNKESLDIIEQALFIVNLEDEVFETPTAFMTECLKGHPKNRFYDKSLQFIVAADGKAGCNMEHSGFDGHTLLILFHNMHMNELSRDIAKPVEVAGFKPEKLEFVVDEAGMKVLAEAEENMRKFSEKTDLCCVDFNEFGSNAMKGCKMSPDAFMQMSYQLAYYRLNKKPGCTYESANTKRFYHGRTGCIRSCSNESVAFCKAFCDEKATSAEKEKLLREAANHHVQNVLASKNGKGIDRHIYVMYCIACHKTERLPNYEIPKLFSGAGMSALWVDLMSTSNSSGSPGLTWFAFGPVSAKCFGIGYVVGRENAHISIGNFEGKAKEFGDIWVKSLSEMRKVVMEVLNA